MKIMKCVQIFGLGILLRGLEQTIAQMGVLIGSVLDELEALNDANNTKTLMDLTNQSSFIIYEQFNEFYLIRAYNKTTYIFNKLREQKINHIIKTLKLILIIYILFSIVLFGLFIYFVFASKNLFNSFLYFIGILPSKYLSEDDNFYQEIINFGNNYFY